MSGPHEKFAAAAVRAIAKHGRSVTLVRRDAYPADSDEPWKGNASLDSLRPVRALFTSDSGLGTELVSRLRRSIRGGEARTSVLIAAADPGFEPGDKPELFDELRDGDEVWGISLADTLEPGTTRILYDYTLEASR